MNIPYEDPHEDLIPLVKWVGGCSIHTKRNFMPHPHPNRMKMRESELLEGNDGEIMFFCVSLSYKIFMQTT